MFDSLATSAEAYPSEHEAVRRAVSGIHRQRGLTPTRRRTALRPADMLAILTAMRPDDRLTDARDAALLLIGWKAAVRTDDLHRLDITDLKDESPETTGGVVDGAGLAVRRRRSRTDQTGTTVTVGITATDPLPDGSPDPLDAVTAWRRWHSHLRAHGLTRGPARRAIDHYGRRPRAARLQAQAINLVVTRSAAAAGLSGDHGGHFLRRGFANSAFAGGAPANAPSNAMAAGPHRRR